MAQKALPHGVASPIQLKKNQHSFSGNSAGKKNKSGNKVGICFFDKFKGTQMPTVSPLLFFLPALLPLKPCWIFLSWFGDTTPCGSAFLSHLKWARNCSQKRLYITGVCFFVTLQKGSLLKKKSGNNVGSCFSDQFKGAKKCY